ncbi:MAG: outer membrane beta-barrel protein, partial [Acidobacteria bacterium]|nr:outer membrane beta-barrel protein [Acidobacteriota bacterium]
LDFDDLDPMTMLPIAKPTTIKADFLSLHLNYVYNFFLHHRDKVVAYVTGGIGINNLSTFGSDVDTALQKMLSELVGEENNITYNFGGGLRIFASKKVGVRFDLRQVAYEVNATDSDDYLEFQFGVTMILGGP